MRPFWKAGSSVQYRIMLIAMIVAALLPTSQVEAIAITGPNTSYFADVQGHRAASAIARWAGLGVIRGDSRGFRPDDPITMAEMSVLLDNLLGLTALSGKPYLDSGTEPWFERAFEAARLAGLLEIDGLGRLAPEDPLTLEQAAVMLAIAFGVDENAGNETSINAAGQIDVDNQLLVFGMEADGYLASAGASSFAPKAFATRAQVITIIDQAIQAFYSAAGVFSVSVGPSAGMSNCVSIVRAGGVILKDMAIDGSLIISEGLASGEFTLDNSALSGNLIIRAGAGAAVRIINGAKVGGRISAQGTGGNVRISAKDAGPLSVDVKSQAYLEGSFAVACAADGSYLEIGGKVAEVLVTGKAKVFIQRGAEVGNIMLYERAAGSVIEVEGTVATIRTEAPDTAIFAGTSSKFMLIETMPEAVGTDIFLNRYAEVIRIDNASSITVSGSGSARLIEGNGPVDYTYSVLYENKQYGFNFNLPDSWMGYSIVLGEWRGSYAAESNADKLIRGPIINIRHPEWREEKPRQDIPIMIFILTDWDALQKEQFHIGAAPIGPSELGRNSEFVFALPARYNFAFPEGYEEVERILKGDPLLTTKP